MKLIFGLLAVLALAFFMTPGCSPKASDTVLLEVGNSRVTLGEYENFYMKNSGGWDAARQSSIADREKFMDLLTNYRLKLQDAADRNLMNDSDIVGELREYRLSLASTFMVDREVTEPGLRLLYDRKLEEIRAQQILISCKADASPEDTLKAFTKALDIVRRAKGGENFDSLAVKSSDDPAVKFNKGDIYYFTGGVMLRSFEDAAYGLQKGDIGPVPVRTPLGYFVIKITERHPSLGSVKVRHIMARFQSPKADSADTVSALARITAARDSLKKGADFSKLAQGVSEDPGSAQQGGLLGWFERRRFVQPFDEAAFLLKAGQTSGIIRTPYGYHLIHCDSTKPVQPLAAIREDLKKQYQQFRFNDDYQNYIGRLKKDFNYSFNDESFIVMLGFLDSTKTTEDSAWDQAVTPSVRSMWSMKVNGRPRSIDTILSVLKNRPELRNTPLRKSNFRTQFDRIGESLLLEARSIGLEERYPEFASLMRDYYDGIVLYKAEQLEVWNKTSVTDSALRSFYEANRSKFRFPDRVNLVEMNFESDTLALLVYDSLRHKGDVASFASRYNEDSELRSKGGVRGMQTVDTDELTKHAATMAVDEISEPIDLEGGGSAIIKVLAKEPARDKTFEEAGAEVSNAYQEFESKRLEQLWLDRIKQRHPVKQYRELLQQAFVSPPPSR